MRQNGYSNGHGNESFRFRQSKRTTQDAQVVYEICRKSPEIQAILVKMSQLPEDEWKGNFENIPLAHAQNAVLGLIAPAALAGFQVLANQVNGLDAARALADPRAVNEVANKVHVEPKAIKSLAGITQAMNEIEPKPTFKPAYQTQT